MMRIPSTQALAAASARHPWRTLGLWLVLIVLAGYAAGGLGDVTSDENRGNSESDRANELISRLQVSTGPATEFVVVESPSPGELPLDQPVLALSRDLLALPETTRVSSFINGRADLLSADRGTALIEVELAPGSPQARAAPIVELVKAADEASDLRVTVVGEGSVNGEVDRLAEETLLKGEIIGVSLALVILLVVMGTVVAALLPIVLAAGSIIVAMGAAALVGEVTGLNELVQNIIVLIGLAVGIDYSFFIVQRYREERGHGLDNLAAITRAGGTASRAVLFSGVAVAIALAGMFIIPFDIFRSLAIGAILVVVAAVAAALTLLPAILSLLGDRVNALPVPLLGRGRPGAGVGPIWSRVIRVVTRRPVLSVGLTTAGLAAVAAFFFTINLGANGINTFPEENDFRHALTVVNAQFSDGVGSADIVIEAEADSAGLASAIAALEASLEADPIFGERLLRRSAEAGLTVIVATLTVDPTSAEAEEAIGRLRGSYLPQAFASLEVRVSVGGEAAEIVDAVDIVTTYLPLVFAFVLGLSFLLLLVVFRSIVVPIKAVLMNLLSVGAAFGLLVLVFQEGVGAGLLGFQRTPTIEFWIPLFLFSILFGLSMDYHVFMLSRIKERFDETQDNSEAVAFGLGSTGAIITGAALIMVAVFGGFAAGELVFFQQLGFGLGVAIILDATIVRLVLVPAAMELLGERNWYFPSWLEWLPRIQIEGQPLPPPSVADAPAPSSSGD